ncbi:MAG: 4'-phosphopantetheinyl transferase superfamily protein [Syntrophobacteraceae bacterium]
MADEVHVWSAYLDLPKPEVDLLQEVLSADEWARAAKFHFPRDRRRFIAGRAALRMILGMYLGVASKSLVLAYGPHGKPMIDGCKDGALRFNLSHSQGLAVIGVTLGAEIGVDVEYMHLLPDQDTIAMLHFSPSENAALWTLPPDRRTEAFFTCWTRKEAYLKALGDGLARQLDSFDVSFLPGEAARLLCVRDNTAEASRWTLAGLTPIDGTVAALAVDLPAARVTCWHWTGLEDAYVPKGSINGGDTSGHASEH